MPQMWQPKKPASIWQFLRQDFEEELSIPQDIEGNDGLADNFRPLQKGGRLIGRVIFTVSVLIFLALFTGACRHAPLALPEPEKATQTFDADEKIIMKAITRVLKDHGFNPFQVEADRGRLETDYVVQGDWRTKVVATIKKISRKENEVTLSVITEEKSFSRWQLRKIMGKDQYDKLFGEIEMQIYREWSKRE